MNNKRFYVYAFIDISSIETFIYSNKYSFPGKPFYIGKGCSNRARVHIKNAIKDALSFKKKSHKLNKIKKIISNPKGKIAVILLSEGLEEEEALDLEKHFIKSIGRHDLKEGPLTNKTDGGEGSSRYMHTEKVRKILSEKATGRKAWNKGLTTEDIRVKLNIEKMQKARDLRGGLKGKRNPMYGKKGEKSPLYGIKKSESHRKLLGESKKGLKNPQAKLCKIITPDNVEHITCVNQFIKEHGERYNITPSFLRNIACGKKRENWTVNYLKPEN